MIFKKKKGMIDVRELQRRGVVRLPKKDLVIPTNNDGFVELGSSSQPQTDSSTSSSNTDFFGFTDSSSDSTDSFSTQTDGYDKKEVDVKITDLDNKIYKLEQRIELLERKLDISSSQSSVGAAGW